jgi:hypothetical protein
LQKKLDQARKAYDAFFEHYPYCYGYWKKYADMERKQAGPEKAMEVMFCSLQINALGTNKHCLL